jgi:hypothetical protein
MLRQTSALVLRAGATYFSLVFGAGFVLGAIRVPFLVPRLGERNAELLEAPVMLAVIFFVSRYIARRFVLAASASVLVGLLALALLVGAELLLGSFMGRSFWDRDPVSGSVFAVSLLLYAALPWLHTRARGGSEGPAWPNT